MLRMGFIEDVEDILKQMPEEKQVALFSATLPDRIRKIVQHHLSDPVEVKIKAKTATVASIDQRFVEIRHFDKLDALTRILEAEEFDAMLVFVRTRTATTEVAEKLEARGFASAALSGDMTQAMRERTIERLKSGKLDIVVATDVAARGLDVERVSHVVNLDIPNDIEGYIHRIGRTGRAGRAGHAILFVTPRERHLLAAIERATRQPITPMRLPTREDVADKRASQFKQRITEVIAAQDLVFFERLVAGYEEEHGTEPRVIAAALAYLAQKDRPLQPPPPERAAAPREERRERHEARGHSGDHAVRAAKADTVQLYADEDRSRAPRRPRDSTPPRGSVRYRIAVGHDHGVQPGNIVGAIANEAAIDSVHIGRIQIFDAYSTVDLPDGMPEETFEQLQNTWVCGQKLALRLDSPGDEPPAGPAPKKKHRKGTSPHRKARRDKD
jgi:ATP-dependent RNA helicase DeaD